MNIVISKGDERSTLSCVKSPTTGLFLMVAEWKKPCRERRAIGGSGGIKAGPAALRNHSVSEGPWAAGEAGG